MNCLPGIWRIIPRISICRQSAASASEELKPGRLHQFVHMNRFDANPLTKFLFR